MSLPSDTVPMSIFSFGILFMLVLAASTIVIMLITMKAMEWIHVITLYEKRKKVVIETVMKDPQFWKEKEHASVK